ncbi:hypothetical protein EDP1_3954 [Pseudomonas putida S610]|nr:hypothetical protein EDP1_3954 [Pseudomonas putida S610]
MFGGQATGKTGEATASPYHAMTGRNDRNRIAAIGSAYRSHGTGVADLLGDLTVRAGFPKGYAEQCVPHSSLKRRPNEFQGQIETLTRAGEVFGQLACGFDQNGAVIITLQRTKTHSVFPLLLPQDSDQPLIPRDEVQRANRRWHEGIQARHIATRQSYGR